MKFDNSKTLRREEEVDLKKLVYSFLSYWYWFVLLGVLGVSGGYFYSKLSKPKYMVSATILIPEETDGLDMKELFDGALDQSSTKIYNQIEIIKSSFTIRKTLLNLNWRTSWYQKGTFVWSGIYHNEPFDVQENSNFVNPTGVKVYITPQNGDRFNVSVDATVSVKGNPKEISFTDSGEFGKPFRNEYFAFTLLKRINIIDSQDQQYCFVFNDLNQLTRSYQSRLNVSLKDEYSDVVVCSVSGEEPEKESDFLNELINVYIAQKLELQNEAQRRSLDFINAQLSGISDSLNIAGNKFTEFRAKNTIIDLGAEGTIVMNNLKEIESERAKSQMQLDYFRNVLSYINESNDLTKVVSPSVIGIEDASLNRLVLKLGDLFNRRQLVSYSAKPNNPTLILIEQELTQTKNQLKENLRNLINNATESINSLKERQSKVNYQLNKLPGKEQQMINIQRQYNITNEIYNFLLQKRAETNISLASSISDIQIIESASTDLARSIGLSKMMMLYIGGFIGMVIPGLFIFFFNLFDSRILTQEDIENNTQLPIVGNIMHNPEKSELAVFNNPKSNIAESFRELRTNLEFMLSGPGPKVISIHSTNPGEGKSYNTINLGTILALNDNRVLIIGADMRKPKLHKIFDVDNARGLSTFLIGYDKLDQIVFPTTVPNLWVLPAGPVPPNPAEILNKPTMKHLLDQVRGKFDYIIIDNAPVALVTDGFMVSRLSDLNIFILRFGVSQKHQLELINQYADTKKVNNIGLIVNDIKAKSFGKRYYKYYQYEAYKKAYYEEEDGTSKGKKVKMVNG